MLAYWLWCSPAGCGGGQSDVVLVAHVVGFMGVMGVMQILFML
jgi:hypothetical protein